MGRTAKYLTIAEKRGAISENSRRYANTAKGRDARNTSQRATYRKRTSRKGPSDTAIPLLPQDLIRLALKPLPTCDLFLSTLYDDDAVDESELDQWDIIPPYTNSTTLSSSTYALNLVDVVHGRHLRNHLKDGRRRMEVFRSRETFRGVRQATLAMERTELEVWNTLLKCIDDDECDPLYVSGVMARHFLQWTARRAYSHHEEVQALTEGRDAYEALFNSRYST